MKEKMIAIDLDGTLALDNSYLSPYTIQGIQKIANLKDYQVIITTGRTWLGTKAIYDACQLTTPVVLYSGAYVLIPHSHQILQDVRIEKDFLMSLLENEYFLSLLETLIIEYDVQVLRLDHVSQLSKQEIQKFKEKINFVPTSLVLAVNQGKNQELMKSFIAQSQTYAYRYWGSVYGEVYHQNLSKKEGIDKVLNYYHATQKDLIFFGDGQNDIEILQYAHTGVAMLNAKEYIQKVADEVTEFSNNEDGVIKHLFKKLNIKE